jgi:hypothetical protein
MNAANCCDHCGKPWVRQENMLLCPGDGDRHPKWQQVPPGTVIPAGQPYRVEFNTESYPSAVEKPQGDGLEHKAVGYRKEWFVDSSWRPPLELPTEPTWGIVRHHHGNNVPSPLLTKAERNEYESEFLGNRYGLSTSQGTIPANQIIDFIPLTDEQIKRIEAAR